MSKKLWRFAVVLILAGVFIFSVGYYCGKHAGIAEITEIVVGERLRGHDPIDKGIPGGMP